MIENHSEIAKIGSYCQNWELPRSGAAKIAEIGSDWELPILVITNFSDIMRDR